MKKIIIALVTASLLGLIFYLPSKAQDEATQESEAVREKVKEKVEEVRKNAKAYLGTITDKTTDGLEIKTDSGEILQAQVNDTTSFVKSTPNSSSKVKFDDTAIGDYTIAMGFRDSSGVLDARRVVLTSRKEPSKKQIIFGVVESIEKDNLKLMDKLTNQSYEIKSGKGLLVTVQKDNGLAKSTFTDIAQGDEVIAVGLVKDDSLEIRRLHVTSPAELSSTPSPEGNE